MSAFKSPFEKLSYEAQREIADSVQPGGAMYDLLEDIADNINQLNARESEVKRVSLFGGLTIKEALAWKFLGEKGLKAIGEGFGAIADVIDGMKTGGDEAKEKMEAIASGLEAIKGLGKAIFEFAGYLLLATPLLMIGVLAAPLFALSLFIITMALSFAAKPLADKQTQEALVAMGDIGMGLLKLGGSLLVFALISPFAIIGVIAAFIVISTLGLAFKVLDALGITDDMEKMAKALAMTGLAILSLGVSLALFRLMHPSEMELLKLSVAVGLTIIGFALAFGIIGIFKDEIMDGAYALMLTGLAIVVLGLSMYLFNMALQGIDDKWEFLLQLGITLGGLGLVMFVIGKDAEGVAMGAGAMIVAGIAIIAIAIGVKIFSSAIEGLDSPWEFLAQVGVTVAGLGLAMAGAGLIAPMIALGAGAMILAGGALIAIAIGVKLMSKVFEGNAWANMVADSGRVTESTLGFGGGRPMSNLEVLMTAIGYSFMWNPFQAIGIAGGAGAMLLAGAAMVSIGKGIEKFQGLSIDYDTFPDQLSTLTNTLAETFGKIGEDYGGAGLFGLGGGLVYQGIQSVMGMGNALSSIAYGMSKMAKLEFPTYNPDGSVKEIITLNSGTMKTINENVADMVSSLATAFGDIGKKYPSKSAGGVMGFLGFTKENPVTAGIRAVSGMGGAIGGIANGMKDMAALKFNVYGDPSKPEKITEIIDLTKGDMLKKVGDNIMKLVSTLVDGFAAIGKTYKDWRTAGDAARGLSLAQEMGPILGDIVKSMSEFAKGGMEEVPKKINEFLVEFAKNLQELAKVDGSAVKSVGNGIEWFFDAFQDEQEGIDVMIAMGKEADALNNVSSFIEKIGAVPATITKTADAIKTMSISMPKMSLLFLGDATDFVEESGKFGNHVIVGRAIKDITNSMVTLGEVNVEGFPTMLDFIEDLEDIDLSDIKKDLRHVAKSYQMIGETTNSLDIEAIVETSNMFKALAYLSEQGGEDAIEALGDDLIEAVEKLALMIADFGGTVEEAREGNQSFIDGAIDTIKSGAKTLFGGGFSSGGGSTSNSQSTVVNNTDQSALLAEIKRLQNILMSGEATFQVESNAF